MPESSPSQNDHGHAHGFGAQDILDNAPFGIFTSTPEGRYISVNPALARMYGYDSPEELIASITDIAAQVYADPADRAEFQRLQEEHGEVVRHESRRMHRDGTVFWVSMNARAVRDQKGRTIAYQGFTSDVSAYKRVEAELRKNEDNYRLLVENQNDLVVKVDPRGRFLFVSPSYCAMFGKAKEELLGQQFMPLVHEDDQESTARAMDALYLPPYAAYLEQRAMTKDGWRWLAWSDRAVLNDDSQITAIVGVGRDITKRKQAEALLRESEERNRLLSDVTMEGIVIHQDGIAKDMNTSFAKLLGHERDALIGKNIIELAVHKDDWSIVQGNIIKEYAHPYEVKGVKKNGETFFAELEARNIEHRGELMRVVAVRDITERKQAETALRESEARYRSIISVSNTGAWEYHRDTDYQWCSPEYFTMLGYDPAEFVMNGKANLDEVWVDHLHPEDRDRAAAYFSQYLNDGSLGMYEQYFRMRHKSGRWLWIWSRGQTMHAPNGTLTNLTVGTHINITERKKLEDQLRQAQKMESIGTLAGGVAHDFNNLLQAMSGNVQLLLMNKQESHPDVRRLQTIAKSIDRSAHLVRQLMIFSRKAEAQRQKVDLNHEVQEAFRILERTIPKMVQIELDLGEQLPLVHADPAQIELVLLNLGSNAAHAMPDGGRLIIETRKVSLGEDFVRAHEGSRLGDYVLLSVTDTGCGMNKDILEHIFEPFFTTKEIGRGTGLGLASVYGIVKIHGGYIQCYSEPGLGTTFRIYWPVVEQEDVCLDREAPKITLQGGNETLLVVDDEPEIRELTQEALESLGYMVKGAANGEEALTICQEHGPGIDLVLLDLNMPGMGGHKCLQELLRRDPSVKVVIASGYMANGLGRDALVSGARGFIGKPYHLKELAAMVRGVLDDEETGAQPE